MPDAPNPPPLKHRRVLLADDDEVSLTIMGMRLRALGATVDLVTDGLEAVAAFRAQQYDLFLTDYSMPGLSGADAVRQMRALEASGRRALMIVVTGTVSDPVQRECRLAGADVVLNKAQGASAVCGVVSDYLRR